MKNISIKLPKLNLGKKVSLDARKARSGYVFALPFILGIVLIYMPILIDAVWNSFTEPATDINGVDYIKFVGLDHYKYALGVDPDFNVKLLDGIQQIIFEVPAIIVFSLFIAVVLNQKMLGRALFRAIFFVPVIISTGLMESINMADTMTEDMEGGVDTGDTSAESNASQIISTFEVEALFRSMKIGGELVTYVVDLVNDIYNIINYSGVQMLIFLAGLQSISPSIYEACRIDGATGWETFWKVTFPMISPMILVNAVYTVIDSFTRTSNPTMNHITNNVKTMSEGLASAMYWIYFLVVALIIAVVAGIASTFIFYQRKD